MINNHVLPRMAGSCAILVVALAHCGCASLKSPSEWATAWKAKPAPKNPSDRETINYVGFGKKKDPKAPNSDDLKSKMAMAGKESRDAAFDKYLRQGNLGLTENRVEDAKRDYEQALKLRPDHPDCHHRLAVIADKQGMFGAADDHYDKARKLRPRDPNLLSDIGYSYSLRGDDHLAESTLKEALAVSPSHMGAMFNLGAIYAKQGRYEDAVAMFRRGCPEAQAMQNVAKLFPQHPAGGPNDFPIARNTPGNTPSTSTPRQDPPVDLLNMNPEQLKAEMNRRKQEGIERRRQQQMAEAPPRQEWMTDVPPQNQRPGADPRTGPPIVLGPGGSQNQNPNQNPNPMNDLPTVTPGNANSGIANNGAFNGNGNQQNPFGQGQPAGNGYPPEQQGSRPSMEVWNGASRDQNIQRVGGQDQSGNGVSVSARNIPPASIHYGPSSKSPLSGLNLQPSLPDMNEPQRAPEMRGADLRAVDQSDNLAAAQLGMNVGGLFPSLPPEAGQGQGQRQPMMDSRFGSEFPAPPQYQNPMDQPGRGSITPGDPRQGNSMNSWGSSNAQPSRSPSRYASFEESAPTEWGQNRVTPAGGAVPNAPRFGNEPVERLPSTNSSHANWADKPDMNGAAPFNGPWPANSGNAAVNTPNSIPMWNGGQNGTQPRSSGQPADYPEQYPFSRGR